MPRSPDHAWSTGGSVFGDDVYVWDCVEGHHVLIRQYSAEMSCQAAVREIVACGEETAFERQNPVERRRPMRRSWRGSSD